LTLDYTASTVTNNAAYREGLHSHQIDAVPWLLDRPKAMLAWEMGVGKTAPLLRAWEISREHGPCAVLCLNTARLNWAREIRKFALDRDWPPRVQIIANARSAIDASADIVILNYDKLLNRDTACHFRRPWGALILDEAHRLKTPNAKRTATVYGGLSTSRQINQTPLIARAARVWLATGTPMPNHPGELYSHARALWPDRCQYNGHLMEQWEWEAAFCEMQQTVYGPAVIGGRNLGELKARLEGVVSVIKRKDVLDLPPLQISTWPLDSGTVISPHTVPDLPGLLGTLEEKYGSMNDIEIFDVSTLNAYLACIQGVMSPLATLRRETAQLKAVIVGLTIQEELDNDNSKYVVFAHHREAISTLEKILRASKPAVVHGDVPERQRQAEIDRFQNDPACRVFIGGLTVAGVSINLQSANKVIFVEASWTPGENDQALSRVYRMGQTRAVWVRFVYLPNSVDEAVSRAIARKVQMINAVF
jgi:SWI/SNF-related matrix-associated actin-dependent regulator of chromatin subfamily A-like protein 1